MHLCLWGGGKTVSVIIKPLKTLRKSIPWFKYWAGAATSDYRKLIEWISSADRPEDFERIGAQRCHRTISTSDCGSVIRQRRRGHWYHEFDHLYEAIDYAAQFIKALEDTNLSITTLVEGVQNYAQTWHHLDHLYRKVIYHARKSGRISLLNGWWNCRKPLYQYYLLKINNNWQPIIDACTLGMEGRSHYKVDFSRNGISTFLINKKKIYWLFPMHFAMRLQMNCSAWCGMKIVMKRNWRRCCRCYPATLNWEWPPCFQ